MKILIRADSSSSIGTGHIMRDLVLAKRDFRDDEIIFAIRDLKGNINQKILNEGFKIEILKSSDIDELIALIKNKSIDRVVIDHYDINYNDEFKIKEQTGCEIFVLDDLYKRHYCNILLNHNIYAKAYKYRDKVPSFTKLLCGKRYLLIRDEIKEAKRYKKKKSLDKKEIFISLGGADSYNLTPYIIKQLANKKNLILNIFTTFANPNLKNLKRVARRYKNTHLYIDSPDFAKKLAQSDISIITPSVIANEAYFLEIPVIAIKVANNQKYMAEFLKKIGYQVLSKLNKRRKISEWI